VIGRIVAALAAFEVWLAYANSPRTKVSH
jgi:hypothetical protein